MSPKRGLKLLPLPLLSPQAMIIPPKRAIPMPIAVSLQGFSPHQNQESNATQMALVVTKVVEATMEVKEREVIQVTKCPAKQIPAAAP